MLSKRLKAISEFIPNNSKVIDVGADHALLDIYLTKEKNCFCIATDISSACIKKARENIEKANVNVETVVTNGLENIEINDEIIILSGLGTKTILNIIPEGLNNDFIISSHTNLDILRKQMRKKGYYIYNEKVIFDKHYYVIIHFKKGKKRTSYHVSPFLTNDKNYMKYLLSKYEKKYFNQKNKLNKIKLYFIIKKIKKHI